MCVFLQWHLCILTIDLQVFSCNLPQVRITVYILTLILCQSLKFHQDFLTQTLSDLILRSCNIQLRPSCSNIQLRHFYSNLFEPFAYHGPYLSHMAHLR